MKKKFLILAAAASAAAAVCGAGVAHAEPDLTGLKWSEASSVIRNMGLQAQVSAQVGDRLDQEDCIVTGHTKSSPPARGFNLEGPKMVVLVSLDCNGAVASAGSPGYSAASPEGRKLKLEEQKREWLASDEGQAYCVKAEKQHPEWAPIPGCH